MGGQKGIASFYSAFSKIVPTTLVSVKKNRYENELSGEFLPVFSNSKTRYINPLLFFTLKKILKTRQSTHLIIEHPYFGWLGLLLRNFLKIQLVVHSHNIESLRFKSTGKWWWRFLWKYEKYIHQKADINFFITEEDRQFAIAHFKLNERKTHTITYGFDLSDTPSVAEKNKARAILSERYSILPDTKILLFNGTLDYLPNLNALKTIIDEINPLLQQAAGFNYKIIICGKNLPAKYNQLKEFQYQNIVYAGFVDDIDIYFKGADLFINPVIDGGGIKTKLVEALGFNLPCISTVNGAIGVPLTISADRLKVIDNGDWKAFVRAILQWQPEGEIGPDFFEHFYWGNIARKAADVISA